MLKVEWKKIRRNLFPFFFLIVILPVVINGLLTFDLHFRYPYLLNQKEALGYTYWQLIFKEQNIFMTNQLLPLCSAFIVYLLFAVEVRNRAWTNINLYKSHISEILKSKFFICVIFILIMLAISCLTIIPAGRITGVMTPIEWELIAKVFFTLLMASVSMASVSLLIITIVPKMVNVIVITAFLFLFSNIVENVNPKVMVLINPFSFASQCYAKSWTDVSYRLIGTIFWVCICLGISLTRLKRGKELE